MLCYADAEDFSKEIYYFSNNIITILEEFKLNKTEIYKFKDLY